MDPPKVISLTLTIDRKQQRVLFARADKAFVDFIFSILIIPMGRSNVGCLPKIYQSVKDLNDDCMVSNLEKCLLLNPKSAGMYVSSLIPPIPPTTTTTMNTTYYRCDQCFPITFLSSICGGKCPAYDGKCRGHMSIPYNVGKPNPHPMSSLCGGRNGFVKEGVVKFMVMDELSVTAFDPSSFISLLKKMNVTRLDAVEEKLVHIDMDKAQALLKVAFGSCNRVLTDVFLGEEATKKRVKKEPQE